MKKGFVYLFAIILYLLLDCSKGDSFLNVVPKPKKISFTDASITIGSTSQMSLSDSLKKKFGAAIDSFKKILGDMPMNGSNILVSIETLSKEKSDLPTSVVNELSRNGSYVIIITDHMVRVVGADEQGTLHGMTTLEKMLMKEKGHLFKGYIADWPDHKIRALHLVLRNVRGRTDPNDIKMLIRKARYWHFNTLVLEIADAIRLNSMDFIAGSTAWSKEQFLEVISFAKENGFEIIPEMNLLTHQERMLKNRYPDLMFNKSTYDPRKEDVYRIIFPIIDEIIDTVHPKRFHIGHDEVAGNVNFDAVDLRDPNPLPPDLYLKDVIRLYEYLKKRNLEVWMWGNMLISPDEFPTMVTKQIHGINNYSKIRDRIPKDIILGDCHFYDEKSGFPSSLFYASSGFKVIGCTWKREGTIKNFSKYMFSISDKPAISDNVKGMIATTWFHVPRKEWDIVDNIIEVSGDAFWNAK